MVSHAPTPRERSSSAPQFWRFLSIYAYTLCCITAKFDMVTHVGEGCVSWGQPHLLFQESGVPAFPNFGGSSVFMPLAQNEQIRHGNTYRRDVFLGGQLRHFMCTNASRGLSVIAEFLVYGCSDPINDRAGDKQHPWLGWFYQQHCRDTLDQCRQNPRHPSGNSSPARKVKN